MVAAIGLSTSDARSQSAPPGVPEPGLVIWGTVVNATNTSQQIAIGSASWAVTDGTTSVVFTASSRPPVQIVSLAGKSHYVLEVPFDTRRFGTVVLADPANLGTISFELRSSSPPTYTLTPTINGLLATVRAIDGAPASGGTVPIPGFTAATRGRVIRVDLAIVPPADNYDTWAEGIFGAGNPNGARGADPDGDGLTNEQEFAAGTDPQNAASSLRILTLSLIAGQTTVGWLSVSNRSYVIEAAAGVSGPWFNVGPPVPGSTLQPKTETSITRDPDDPRKFYRVRVIAP
jgi:hypothetical protein